MTRCPRCGADEVESDAISRIDYTCGTYILNGVAIFQSAKCFNAVQRDHEILAGTLQVNLDDWVLTQTGAPCVIVGAEVPNWEYHQWLTPQELLALAYAIAWWQRSGAPDYAYRDGKDVY